MSLTRFPGFIDIHVHLREPGATHKEDFYTGSRAAVAGGFTYILDMPNNPEPTISKIRLEEKIELSKKAICDIGFHFGTDGKNMDEFEQAWENPNVFGLKIYCNHTTGDMLIEDHELLGNVFKAWNSLKPILVHAEGKELITVLQFADKYKRRLHVCHVSQGIEVDMIRLAKMRGQKVTAGVTPHHLFFYDIPNYEKLGNYAVVKPAIKTREDQAALWNGIKDGTIDIVETDHAPHTREEKEKENPAFGMPGLETALGLMFLAVKEERITADDVIRLLYTAPKIIFNIPMQDDTYVELDIEKEYIVGVNGYETKCGWSIFEGMTLYGKIETVVINGKKILEGGNIL